MPSAKYILALDQGTTGSRAFIFDRRGRIAASAYQEFRQYFPKPGWVEHDADEIWASCETVIRKAARKAKVRRGQIAAIGITNQRETTVLWDRATSKPVGRAIGGATALGCGGTEGCCVAAGGVAPAGKEGSPVMREANFFSRMRSGGT